MKSVLLLIFLVGCAGHSRQTEALLKRASLSKEKKLERVPFIEQKANHCGPASVAMVMEYWKRKTSLPELTSQMFTPGKEGTFQTDLLMSVRRQGLLAVPVEDLSSLVEEVEAGHPVIVFQNLGLSWWPKWHYAVVVGFDFAGPDIILHSGDKKFLPMDMRYFERTWDLAQNWGLVVLPPERLAQTADELKIARAASALELLGKNEEARLSYLAMLKRWPKSLIAHLGLGNVYYNQKKFKSSVRVLKAAALHHPDSSYVQNNLATAMKALKVLTSDTVHAVGPTSIK